MCAFYDCVCVRVCGSCWLSLCRMWPMTSRHVRLREHIKVNTASNSMYHSFLCGCLCVRVWALVLVGHMFLYIAVFGHCASVRVALFNLRCSFVGDSGNRRCHSFADHSSMLSSSSVRGFK